MRIEEDSAVFEGNRYSDVTIEVVEEKPNASFGEGNEKSFELEDRKRQSFQLGSSDSDEETGFRRVLIKAQEDGENHQMILLFCGELGPVKSPTKKLTSWKLKSSTFLTVTSQLVGSLLAVSKQGSGPSAKAQTLLITSVLGTTCAFLLFLFAHWLKYKSAVGAKRLEMVGCALTVVGFIGMAAIVFF